MNEKQLKTSHLKNNNMNMNAKKLQTLSKQELVDKCKDLNLNCYGTKFDMVQRILASQKSGIIHDIKHNIPPIVIRKEEETGVYVHEKTNLVFDPNEKRAIGRKNSDGTIRALQYDDIKMCLKYKFRYLLPENLAIDDDLSSSSSLRIHGNKSSKTFLHEDAILENRLKEIESQLETPSSKSTMEDDDCEEEEEDVDDVNNQEDDA